MEEYESQAPSRVGGCLVQAVSHGAALVLGAVLGIGGARVAEYYSDPEMLSRPEGELSRAELIKKLDDSEAAYARLLEENSKKQEVAQNEITVATKKVVDLESQVTKKQDEITVLEVKAKKSAGKSAALKKELEAKLAELESLKLELQTALEDKQRLEVKLQETEADLETSRGETVQAQEETKVAQSETVDARWTGFVSEGIVTICEKGNRNKLAKCKEEVRSAFSSSRASKFKHCVASRQAQPRLVRWDDKAKDQQMPRWSEWVDEESTFTKNKWFVTFCDPTLPESTMGDKPSGGSDDVLDDL